MKVIQVQLVKWVPQEKAVTQEKVELQVIQVKRDYKEKLVQMV